MPSRGLLRHNRMFRNIQTHKLPQQIHLEGHRMGSTGHQQGRASRCSSVGVPASVPVVQVQGDRHTSGKYGSYSGLKASCPMGASISYNNPIEITSRVPTRDMSLPRVTVVQEAQRCGFLSGICSSPSLDTVHQFGVISTICNVA